jgi:hypothetical protein
LYQISRLKDEIASSERDKKTVVRTTGETLDTLYILITWLVRSDQSLSHKLFSHSSIGAGSEAVSPMKPDDILAWSRGGVFEAQVIATL